VTYDVDILSRLTLDSKSFEAVVSEFGYKVCDRSHGCRREASVGCAMRARLSECVENTGVMVCAIIGDVETEISKDRKQNTLAR